jgi:uncharacterized protein YerC
MLRLMKRHEIQVLLRAHHTQKKIAELTGVSISSVRRVAKESPSNTPMILRSIQSGRSVGQALSRESGNLSEPP